MAEKLQDRIENNLDLRKRTELLAPAPLKNQLTFFGREQINFEKELSAELLDAQLTAIFTLIANMFANPTVWAHTNFIYKLVFSPKDQAKLRDYKSRIELGEKIKPRVLSELKICILYLILGENENKFNKLPPQTKQNARELLAGFATVTGLISAIRQDIVDSNLVTHKWDIEVILRGRVSISDINNLLDLACFEHDGSITIERVRETGLRIQQEVNMLIGQIIHILPQAFFNRMKIEVSQNLAAINPEEVSYLFPLLQKNLFMLILEEQANPTPEQKEIITQLLDTLQRQIGYLYMQSQQVENHAFNFLAENTLVDYNQFLEHFVTPIASMAAALADLRKLKLLVRQSTKQVECEAAFSFHLPLIGSTSIYKDLTSIDAYLPFISVILDAIFIDEDGNLTIVDWKKSLNPETQKIQALFYLLLGGELVRHEYEVGTPKVSADFKADAIYRLLDGHKSRLTETLALYHVALDRIYDKVKVMLVGLDDISEPKFEEITIDKLRQTGELPFLIEKINAAIQILMIEKESYRNASGIKLEG